MPEVIRRPFVATQPRQYAFALKTHRLHPLGKEKGEEGKEKRGEGGDGARALCGYPCRYIMQKTKKKTSASQREMAREGKSDTPQRRGQTQGTKIRPPSYRLNGDSGEDKRARENDRRQRRGGRTARNSQQAPREGGKLKRTGRSTDTVVSSTLYGKAWTP